MAEPLRLAFLGCGFITRVHSRNLRRLGAGFVCSYASRDRSKGEAFRRQYGGVQSFGDYAAAIEDPAIDAVVVAVPPRFHLDLTLQALAAGKHVLVEKPAFPRMEDFHAAAAARDRAKRVVMVGENDHYKPLAVEIRKMLARGVIGDLVFAHFVTIAKRLKTSAEWPAGMRSSRRESTGSTWPTALARGSSASTAIARRPRRTVPTGARRA
jgi:UDP-N-acetylglucosamine 3-dehydrogenase